MKTIVLLLLVATVAYGQQNEEPIEITNNPTEYIIGGQNANFNENRHLIRMELFYRGEWRFICSGNVIGEYAILTAMHCCDINGFGKCAEQKLHPLSYTDGDMDSQCQQDQHKSQYVPHIICDSGLGAKMSVLFACLIKRKSESESGIFIHDVCILKPTTRLNPDYIIPLAAKNKDYTGKRCTAAGWGRVVPGGVRKLATVMQAAEGVIMSRDACRAIWTDFVKIPDAFMQPGNVCFIGYADSPASICNGDSGGPLVCDGELVGVASWGVRGCWPSIPSVFMNVAKHGSWIRAQIKE